jgi:hypothetical protein
VTVLKWDRKRSLNMRLYWVLQVEGKGVDGEEVRIRLPTASEILELIKSGCKQEISNLGTSVSHSSFHSLVPMHFNHMLYPSDSQLV